MHFKSNNFAMLVLKKINWIFNLFWKNLILTMEISNCKIDRQLWEAWGHGMFYCKHPLI